MSNSKTTCVAAHAPKMFAGSPSAAACTHAVQQQQQQSTAQHAERLAKMTGALRVLVQKCFRRCRQQQQNQQREHRLREHQEQHLNAGKQQQQHQQQR
ncbi:hypothetical protein Esti_006787 [Eimeria stiedai]